MRALNPFTGEFYREALQVSRYTREMFCLMEGRHVHPSTLYPGGVGTVRDDPAVHRLLHPADALRGVHEAVVPMHDDLFDFIYEALPGYEEVGRRRVLLGCWGSLNDPDHCDFQYQNMTDWGRKMFVTPGVVVDGKLVTNDLVEINLGIRILLGQLVLPRLGGPGDVRHARPAGQPGRPAPPVEPAHDPGAAEARLRRQVLAGRCRRAGSTARTTWRSTPAAARSPGCGPRRWPGWWTSASSSPPGTACRSTCRARSLKPEVELRVEAPGRQAGRAAVQRDRAQPRPHLLPGLRGRRARCTSSRRRWPRCAAATRRPGRSSRCRTRRSAAGSPRRSAACCQPPHGDPRRQDRELPPVPADAVERQRARQLRHAGPVRGRGAEHADLRGEPQRELQGHRHHARGAQLRPVPAVRRAHVPRRRRRPLHMMHVARHAQHHLTWRRSWIPTPPGSPNRSRSCSTASRPGGAAPARRGARAAADAVLRRGAGADRRRSWRGRAATDLVHRLAADPLVGGLLALHDLHPVPVRDRVEHALATARRKLGAHGGGRAARHRRRRHGPRVGSPGGGCGAATVNEIVVDEVIGERRPRSAGVAFVERAGRARRCCRSGSAERDRA